MTLQLHSAPVDELRRLELKLLPTPTVADNLRVGLAEINYSLECARGNVGYISDVIRSDRARRLARRRGVAIIADTAVVLDMLDILEWVLGEALGQRYELTGALGALLEPVRTSKTRYGRRTGVFAHAPYDWGKCGTPAGYQAHRRRGQDCALCRKAATRYEADRRWRRGIGELSR
jgi:hypothetical protein